VHPVFRSKKGSIVAAREAKDGSGVLAVASSNVVVLHDTKRAKEESWGLTGDQDEVRYLEYGPDAKSLFLTTATDGAIQHYDTERSRMLEPAEKLAMPPATLAVSATGHLVLSASQNPPVIYLKNMMMNNPSLRLHPNASASSISCAAFHPERPNVFMVAFRDGTVAAYDASRMPKRDFGVHAAPGLKDGEIGHISSLHRGTVGGDSSLDKSTLVAPIIGIAFLPGFKTRAVTAGRDGRCKIIDFANGGEVLRTWHARAPLTSISVIAIRSDTAFRSARGSRQSQPFVHTIGGPTSTDSVIALGRIDGKVQIYDTVGLMLTQKSIAGQEEKILSVEWIKGDSPRVMETGGIDRHFSEASSTSLRPQTTKTPPAQAQSLSIKKPGISQTQSSDIVRSTRKLVIHPDEIEEESTVRRKPAAKNATKSPMAVVGFQDLFSPIKSEPTRTATQEPISSPRRSRPRLSSQTFVQSPSKVPRHLELATPRGPTIIRPVESHATSSASAEKGQRNRQTSHMKSMRRKSKRLTPGNASVRRISFAQDNVRVGDGTMRSRESVVPGKASANAKVLADLRRLAQGDLSQRNSGTLSLYATSHRHTQPYTFISSEPPQNQPQHSRDHTATSETHGVHVSDPDTWPTDSVISSLRDNEDIWLTSESEDELNGRRRHRVTAVQRPPGRQTSRSRVDHTGGTMSTAVSHVGTQCIPSSAQALRLDGSTEEEMFSANSHLLSDGAFSPASADVRGLFPRSSSLSPRKYATSKTRKHIHVSPDRKGLALTAISLNQALGRQPKSPWAKAKATRRAPSPRKDSSAEQKRQQAVQATTQHISRMDGVTGGPSVCVTCPEIGARVQDLENEVAILKGEVLAMKSVLRRNGLPFPACLR
jgi:WD40 repeat protein